ncbi:hypothetical protein AAVH_26000 [Aphelenchoides avenae]|nr:hypothetical protein AAVH_26000 [Aphelenchus avenae]
MIRGLRPDAVVMMPLKPSDAEMMDHSPAKAEKKLEKEVLVAYKEAKALPNCTVVCDDLSLGLSRMQFLKIITSRTKPDADLKKRMEELKEKMAGEVSELEKKRLKSEGQKLILEANPHLCDFTLDRELYATYIIQRTLNERASEKYQRLQASEKDKLEPVRILTLTNEELEGFEKNWQRRIEKQHIDELLKKNRQSDPGFVIAIPMRAVPLVLGIALLVVVGVAIYLVKLVWDLAFHVLKKKHLSDD